MSKLALLAKELPKNNFNVNKTAKKLGYSEQYANKSIYTRIGKSRIFKDYYSEESIKAEQKKALKKFKRDNDNSNYQRALEHMAKIGGIIIDKSEVKSDVNIQNQDEALKKRFNISPSEN